MTFATHTAWEMFRVNVSIDVTIPSFAWSFEKGVLCKTKQLCTAGYLWDGDGDHDYSAAINR